jgi:trigger factor
MQVSVENTGGLERRLTVHVPEDEILGKVESKLRELCKQVKIAGFRPGRVPISVVRQRYGKQVRQDIVGETIQTSLRQAIQDESLRPASMPRLDSPEDDFASGDLEFSALIEVYPELGTIDVSSLELTRPEARINDEDVQEMLQTLREQRKNWDQVERNAREGDKVVIEYSAESKEGRVPDEGRQKQAVIMGESGFDDLEKAIAKIPPGEEKNIKLKFPENFREPLLADKKAKVDLRVESVSEGSLPEVDEDFIKTFGIADGSVETLHKEIQANLERELEQAMSSMMKTQLIKSLVDSMPDLEVPASIVKQEAESMAAQATSGQGMEPDASLADLFMEVAEGRVRGGLLLGELAQQNNIRIDGARVRKAIEKMASTYEQPAEVMQMYYSNQQLLQQVESVVMEEQVVDWVLENAKVTPQEMKFQEVIAAAAEAANQAG